MKYDVTVTFSIEAETLGRAAWEVAKILEPSGMPRGCAVAVTARVRAALDEMAAYRQGREEHRVYRNNLEELQRLMTMEPPAAADSPEGKRIAELAAECDDYEQANYPIGQPTAEASGVLLGPPSTTREDLSCTEAAISARSSSVVR